MSSPELIEGPKVKVNCDCGRSILLSSLNCHLKTKKHLNFMETGVVWKPHNHTEYTYKRLNGNIEHRQKQRNACNAYYQRNRAVIREKQTNYRKSLKIKDELQEIIKN